jgi:nucleotide-binding universal stress UspA family protein
VYHHVLLAIDLQHQQDFSPHAVAARDAAVALAKGAGARLSVLSVYEYDDLNVSGLGPEELGRYRETQMQRIDALMEQKMKEFLQSGPTDGLALTPMAKIGTPRQQIVDTAGNLGADLVVIGAHSKRSVLDVLQGGTAAYVRRHAPCSVITVQPGHGEKVAM